MNDDISVISTGIPALDNALGIGGIPRGRIVEVYGQHGTGKTTLVLSLTTQAQRQGLRVAYIDGGGRFDRAYAERLGVDVGALLLERPVTLEGGLALCEALVKTGEVGLVIVDPVTALACEADGCAEDEDDATMPGRVVSGALRRLAPLTNRTNATVVFTTDTQMEHGGYGPCYFTTPYYLGRALRFYSSVRIHTACVSLTSDGNRPHFQAIVNKNKFAAPHQEARLDLSLAER